MTIPVIEAFDQYRYRQEEFRMKRKHHRNDTIRYRLTLLVLGCSVSVLLVFLAFVFPAVRTEISEINNSSYTASLEDIGGQLSKAFSSLHLNAASLSIDGGVASQVDTYLRKDALQIVEKETLKQVIQGQLIQEDIFSSLVGAIAYFSPGEPDVSIISNCNLNYFDSYSDSFLYTEKPYSQFSIPHPSVQAEQYVLSLTRYIGTVTNDYKSRAVYLYLETDIDYLQALFSNIAVPTYLVDPAGTVLYTNDTALFQIGQTFLDSEISKTHILYAYEAPYWGIRACVPRTTYNQGVFRVVLPFFLMLSIFIVVLVFQAVLVSRFSYHPIETFLKELTSEKSIRTNRVPMKQAYEYKLYYDRIDAFRNQITVLLGEVEEQEKRNSQLEYQLLLSRINPHFLYNTLHSISVQADKEGLSDISQSILALNQLLYHNLGRNKITTLQEELQAASNYIQLISRIYQFTFIKNIQISDSFLATHIPSFVLQPLIENCFKHGNTPYLSIILSVYVEEEHLFITLEDNGKGMSISTQEYLNRKFETADYADGGIGLRYVSASLKLFFADKVKVEVSSGANDVGTKITIRICFR